MFEGLCLMVTMISSCCLSGQLAKELKQQECLQYAGFCNLAMAHCEQTLFNAPGEALALTEAARLFLETERETQRLQCPGFEEHLQAAANCYTFASKVYIELNQPVMAASLYLELGNALKAMNKPGEAFVSYQRAAELQTQVPIECVLSLDKVASCKLLTRDSDGALAVFTEMQLLAQEKGLHLPGTNIPVGEQLSSGGRGKGDGNGEVKEGKGRVGDGPCECYRDVEGESKIGEFFQLTVRAGSSPNTVVNVPEEQVREQTLVVPEQRVLQMTNKQTGVAGAHAGSHRDTFYLEEVVGVEGEVVQCQNKFSQAEEGDGG
ncbi:40-kDa huntingtin-associated protein [Callorhinchus milii]|uniref:40-kDa huntingtin-associated protein n=1 Tax=Callorhinchus milii TaxID=7868 RepID=UPI001C3FC3CF|nr:40-kDa huntingtin-associated protein [Callorhinchus milii]